MKDIKERLGEAAKYFNDALLDEQAKLLKERGKEISRLNGIIHKKNKLVSDKDAVLSDVAEELRLSKIREENLTETCKKYLKEIQELREKLANIVVNNVDAQALKSAESALAYKDKVIDRLKRKYALLKKKNSVIITHDINNDFMNILRLW